MRLSDSALLTLIPLIATVYILRSQDASFSSFAVNHLRVLSSQATKTVLDQVCGDVVPTDAYSESEIEKSENIMDSVTTLRGGNPLKDLILQNKKITDSLADYGIGLIKVVAFNPAFFVITILVSWCICCNWCCMYCPCCKESCTCCNRCCKEPKKYSAVKKKVYFVASITLSLGVFAAGIAGAAISAGMGTGITRATCATVYIMDVIVRGNTEGKWAGMNGAYDAIQDLSTNLQTIKDDLSNVGTDMSGIDTKLAAVNTEIDDFYTNNNALTLPRPDTSKGTYQNDYVDNLGPRATADTFCYLLGEEMQVKRDTVDTAITNINAAIDNIQDNFVTFQDALNTGLDTTQSLIDSVVSVTESLGDVSDLINSLVKVINKAVLAVFIVILLAGASGVGSILLTCLCKWKWSNKITHSLVFTLLLFSILGFLINTIMFPIGIVSVEVCGVLDATFNDESFMTQVLSLYMNDQSVEDIILTCTFGDGDLMAQFGVADQIQSFDDIFTGLGDTSSYMSTSGAPNSIVIPYQKELLDKYKSGETPDSSKVVTDLATLNAEANPSGGCTNDGWVLNKGTCDTAYSGYYVLKSSDSNSFGVPDTEVCIGFNDWVSRGTTTGNSRYSSVSCASSWKGKVNDFVTNRNALSTQVGTLKTGLNDISTLNDDFMTEIQNLIEAPFGIVEDAVASVQDTLTDPDTGLLTNMKCTAVFDTLRNLRTVLCVGFVTSLYQTAIVLAVVSFFSLFGAFFVFCFAKRGLVKEDKVSAKN